MSPPAHSGRHRCAAERGADGAARRPHQVQEFNARSFVSGRSLHKPEEHPTSNTQRRTSNGSANPRSLRRSKFDVGHSMFSLGSGAAGGSLKALSQSLRESDERLAAGRARIGNHHRHTAVAADADFGVDRDVTEEMNVLSLGFAP